jgi:hypothetical protein
MAQRFASPCRLPAVKANALQADGRWLAAGTQVSREGGQLRWMPHPGCGPAAQATVELARDGLRLPEDLRPGRFYPARLFGRALGPPARPGPVRLLGFSPDGRLLVDPNHPLAAQQVSLVLAPASGAGGTRACAWPNCSSDPACNCRPPPALVLLHARSLRSRRDAASDIAFYTRPRLTQHLDARCRAELATLYGHLLQPGMRVLDLMASVDSHLPPAPAGLDVAGLGLNGGRTRRQPAPDGTRGAGPERQRRPALARRRL